MTLDPVMAWTLRASLAGIFLAAAWHKWRRPRGFQSTVGSYALLPAPMVPAVAALLPWIEGWTALGLLHAATLRPAVLVAETVLAVYTAAIAINLARGRRHIDCGCFTSSTETPLSTNLLARNLGLMAAGAALLRPIGMRTLSWLDGVTIVLALVALGLVWSATQRLARTGPALRKLGGVR